MAAATPSRISRALRGSGFKRARRGLPGFRVTWRDDRQAVVVEHDSGRGDFPFGTERSWVASYRLALGRKGWCVSQAGDYALVTKREG